MAGQSLVYSNARVKAMENTLLSGEKITRMVYAENLTEAVKVLYESSYGGGAMVDNPYCFADILKAEEKVVTDFMREAMPDGSGLETLLTPLDYHNAKAYYKAKTAMISDVESMLSPQGNIPREVIETAVGDVNYNALPSEMADTLRQLDGAQSEGTLSPRMIDVELDKALYRDINRAIKKCKAKSVKKYWSANIDLMNVSILLRAKRIGADIGFFRENIIEGGEISIYILEDLYDESLDVVGDKLRYTDVGRIIDIAIAESKAGGSLVKYETEWDNYLLDIFREGSMDIFTVAPIAGFYVAKRIELKTVRMILTAIKNKAGESEIKARLRGLYA